MRSSETELPDGSLFVPIELLDGQEKPYDSLTAWKRGSYWNLVMPYVLASGLFPPGSREADGVFRYMLNHGSRFLGLVRFSPHTGVKNPGYQAPGPTTSTEPASPASSPTTIYRTSSTSASTASSAPG